MRNPWTKKNPMMSMWLSAANKAVGSARGQATAATKRQLATTQTEATRSVLDFWTGATAKPAAKPAAKRKARR
ncbi:hypothetical protein [Pseudorhodoferax sp. Leaf274]|uniref:hypothetical protein n=1 Tax=Pseudorhodoferax sp. Leaf274 TaxID=1736318 RepID=UPI000702C1FC|nr:hypothetical protein [Pseudorhodoferax sp. Leaf274]KQP37935.1 hypothetical protein ASF44_11960 [Pseudorhodoferax sp. Leaf274]